MAKCFKAVRGGIGSYAWTSARSHVHHLIHCATASLHIFMSLQQQQQQQQSHMPGTSKQQIE
ncbi:hypothetical protein E2C01_007913 [Portunus trituberculatus]|uniref:Uncharacterized protein n=1 Tax=Portunus trituberculatus TaxID=210409 RepID=A0A5B7D1P9_PORTR|nr:hypothetical protein [Portunus trituberculatus]